MCRRNNGNLINVGPTREFIEVETPEENNWPVMYKNYVVQILRMQVLLACNKHGMFRLHGSSCSSGLGAACHTVKRPLFGIVAAVTLEWVIISGKPKT